MICIIGFIPKPMDGWIGKKRTDRRTIGLDKQMEAIQIRIVKRMAEPPALPLGLLCKKPGRLTYQTHVQSYGWQNDVGQGKISGTVGQAKRLEAIRINVHSTEGSIRYRTHVQTYGWQDWAYDGEESGTVGQAKRLEAIQIELTGGLAEKL